MEVLATHRRGSYMGTPMVAVFVSSVWDTVVYQYMDQHLNWILMLLHGRLRRRVWSSGLNTATEYVKRC